MTVRVAPCTWPVLGCGESDALDCSAFTTLSATMQTAVESAAVEYLWRWTGRRFGLCDVTVRPCRTNCNDWNSTFWGRDYPGWIPQVGGFIPAMIRGQWYNLGCGTCGDVCSCSVMSSLVLPGPVASVSEVIIDGVVVDPTAYRVDNAKYLIRTDGGLWPVCQDMAAPSGSDGTWSVTYQYGIPVPYGGQLAAGVLACELAKAFCNDSSCALPQRLRTVTRQGVTVAVIDSFDDIDKGHTGIWAIDSWMSSVTRSPQPMGIRSPDYKGPRVRRTTWP